MRHLLVFFILIAAAGAIASAQSADPVIEWGNVTPAELAMTSYPPDTNAAALVLFKVGRATYENYYDLVFKFHARVKIFSKAGYDFATIGEEYNSKEGVQRVGDIEGATYALDANGKVVRTELKDNDIFTENMNGSWKKAKFTLPALSPGCVIEYRYTVKSTSPLYLPDWTFQETIPCLWSEYEMKVPMAYTYASINQSALPFYVQTVEQIQETFSGPGGMKIVPLTHARFVKKDVPAMREEPYITTLDDYRERITFQLSSVMWPGEMRRPFLESWEKLAEELDKNDHIGMLLRGGGEAEKEALAVTAGLADPQAKMAAIFNFVRSTISWNGRSSAFAGGDLDDLLSKKTGNSADVNILLTAMLRSAGFDALPVLMSTRGHGKIQDLYPIVDQFNYLICRVMLGGKPVLLDATDRVRSWRQLPYRALNHRGYLLNGGTFTWVPVESDQQSTAVTVAAATVDAAGAVAAAMEEKFSDYRAYRERDALDGAKPEEYVRKLFNSEKTGLAVDSFTIANKESLDAPMVVRAKISSGAYAQQLNEVLYINPMLSERTFENPLTAEHRRFPVDYAYPQSTRYILNLRIPAGYAVKSSPPDLGLEMTRGEARYSRLTQVTGDLLQMKVNFSINQATIQPERYTELRNFYNDIVTHEAEQIVLEKRAPATAAPAADPPPAGKKAKKGKK